MYKQAEVDVNLVIVRLQNERLSNPPAVGDHGQPNSAAASVEDPLLRATSSHKTNKKGRLKQPCCHLIKHRFQLGGHAADHW